MSIANMQGLLGSTSSIPAWMLTNQNPATNLANLNSSGTTTYDPNGGIPFTSLDPQTLAQLQALGWKGGNPIISQGGSGGNQDTGPTPSSNTFSPQFQQFLAQNGITPSLTAGARLSQNLGFYNGSSTSPTTGQIGSTQTANFGNDDAFMIAAMLALGGAGAAAAGAGVGGAAAAGETGGGLSSTDLAALYGDAGYGSTGSGLAASDVGGLAGTGLPEYGVTQGAASAPLAGDATGTGILDAGDASLASGNAAADDAALAGVGSNVVAPSSGLLGTGLTGAQIASGLGTAASTAGSLLSTPGVGSLIGAGAGLLGAGSGLNSATTTQAKTIDPRIAQYIYGTNGTSGLLGDTNSVLNSQLATGGLNANQQAGLASQLAVLNNPNYSTGFNQEKSLGSSLLGQPVAGNPFTGGVASMSSAPSMGTNLPVGAPQPLAGTFAPGQSAGRMQIPAAPANPLLKMRNGGAVRMGLL